MDNRFHHPGSTSCGRHTQQVIRGITGGDNYAGGISQDFSYENFGADADMATSNALANPYPPDDASLPPISSTASNYAANQALSLASYASNSSAYNAGYHHTNRPNHPIQLGWPLAPGPSNRYATSLSVLDPALSSVPNPFTMRNEMGSASSSQILESYPMADHLGLGIQSHPSLSSLSFTGGMIQDRSTLSIPFQPIDAQSLQESHSPTTIGDSPSPASVDEPLFSPISSTRDASLSFNRRQEAQPSLMLSPAALPSCSKNSDARLAAATFMGSRGANQMRRSSWGQHAKFGSYGRYNNPSRSPSEFTSSSGGPRSPSTGYAPSETESSCTTPPACPDPQYLSVPNAHHSRRRSEPPPLSIFGSSSPLNRSQSSRSTRIVSRTPHMGARAREGPSSPLMVTPRPPRGRRVGGLPDATRDKANRKRVDRSVCIGCKISKIACEIPENSSACSKCASQGNNERKPFVCISAYFYDNVQKASTITIGQYAIDHISENGTSRRRLELPSSIDMVDLLDKIETWGEKWNIRVYQDHIPLYDLNLRACHSYLKSHGAPERLPFRKFINRLPLNKSDTWKDCVRDLSGHLGDENPCEALIVWNEMPGRFTYSLIERSRSIHERVLNSNNEGDLEMLYAAAQLAFIVARKLELTAYDYLQKVLIANSQVTPEMLLNLGHIVLSLRRRLVWWDRMGTEVPRQRPNGEDGSAQSSPYDSYSKNKDDDDDDCANPVQPVARVIKLCKILYIYYCFMERRASYLVDRPSLATYVVSYPNSKCSVQEKFPTMESWNGYDKWMQEGFRNFDESGVESHMVAMEMGN